MDFDLFSMQSLICCAAFFFAGILDSISGGGGLLTVPAMMVAGIPTHNLIGTNQCSAWFGSFAATFRYMKSGMVHYRSAVITVPFAVVGSYLGARLNLMMPEKYLEMFIIVMIPVVAVFMVVNKKLGSVDEIDTVSDPAIFIWSALIGFIMGGYQGFYGPGSGVFFMLAYAASIRLSLVRATANTRFVIAFASCTAVIAYALSGTVIWKFAVAGNIFYGIGSYIGAVLAIKKGSGLIRPLTLIVVAVLMVKLVFFR